MKEEFERDEKLVAFLRKNRPEAAQGSDLLEREIMAATVLPPSRINTVVRVIRTRSWGFALSLTFAAAAMLFFLLVPKPQSRENASVEMIATVVDADANDLADFMEATWVQSGTADDSVLLEEISF